jgi:hypothetical protein
MGTLNTNSIPLFGGEYYAQARFTYEKDPINRTIKVTVNGVRAYSKYGWNFRSDVKVWLATDSKGSGKVSGSTTIESSGSRYYEGWLPKPVDGKASYKSISVSKTFKYNSDGSLPNIYLHIESANPNVLYISAGTYHSVHVSITKNIGTTTYLDTLDVRKPTITFEPKSLEVVDKKVKLTFYGTSGYKIDSWQYKIGNGSATSMSVKDDYNSALKAVTNLSFTRHTVYIRGRRKYNHVWSDWVSKEFDCRLPDISNLTLTPKSVNTAELNYNTTADYDCQYRLYGPPNSGINTGWLKYQGPNKNLDKLLTVLNNQQATYTFNLKRVDNGAFVQTRTINCDTQLPTLNITSVVTSGSSAVVTVTSNVPCKDWTIFLNGIKQPKVISTAQTSLNFTINNLIIGNNNTIKVTAVKVSNGLLGSVTRNAIKVTPGVIINTPDGITNATVYIYDDKQWKVARPYVFVEDLGWQQTK